MPLWRLRAHMSFLVDNLQYYLQVNVLDVRVRVRVWWTTCSTTCR